MMLLVIFKYHNNLGCSIIEHERKSFAKYELYEIIT
jgi:hypothetical protein